MDAILGQSHAVDQLRAALSAGRLHHAFIFYGPVGVGKFTTALAFAKVVLCHRRKPDGDHACGKCDSCILFSADDNDTAPGPASGDGHPDLHIINKELARFHPDSEIRKRKQTRIPIEVIRYFFIEPVNRSALLGHGKIFIVDEAELISDDGKNAVLKTLEEPPPDTVLVLITTNEDRLLPTIRSRCQRIGFLPLPDKIVGDLLDQRGKKLPDAEKRFLLSFAAGSIGRAALAHEYGLSAWARAVIPGIDLSLAGDFQPGLGRQIATLIDELAKRWVEEHEQASKEAANRMAAGLMFSLIAEHARRKLAAHPDDPQPWLALIDALALAESNLAANVNPTLTCEHLIASLAPVA